MQYQEAKLIFAGSVGSGKTTAIACLSDIPPVSTDVDATDETKDLKQTTTVAMDYGFMQLGDGQYVHLYGSPGQDRFNFMWDILSDGALGLILMVDATNPKALDEMAFYLDSFKQLIESKGAVIGITRSDLAEKGIYTRVQEQLKRRGMLLPIFEVDARDLEQVKVLVNTLMLSLSINAA